MLALGVAALAEAAHPVRATGGLGGDGGRHVAVLLAAAAGCGEASGEQVEESEGVRGQRSNGGTAWGDAEKVNGCVQARGAAAGGGAWWCLVVGGSCCTSDSSVQRRAPPAFSCWPRLYQRLVAPGSACEAPASHQITSFLRSSPTRPALRPSPAAPAPPAPRQFARPPLGRLVAASDLLHRR